jgi:hypothetical protein
MANLSDFQRGQIVSASMACISVTETSHMFVISGGTVSKVMMAVEWEGKTSSAKHMFCQKFEVVWERPKWNCDDNQKTTAVKITTDLNGHLQNQVSIKAVCWELHRSGSYGRAAIRKPLVLNTHASKHLEWCKNLHNWSLEQWKMWFSWTNHRLPYF